MEKEVNIIGLITARKGSKRLPGKNIKELNGKPLILYTVDSAIESGVFKTIILSTDDEKAIEIVRNYTDKVSIPFTRPPELAQDNTPHLPVVLHALLNFEEGLDYEIPKYHATMILQPTSPFRNAKHIQEAVELFLKNDCDSVLGVTEVPNEYHPERTFYMKDDRLIICSGREVKNRLNSVDGFPPAYSSNAAIYLFYNDVLKQYPPNFYGDTVLPYVMDAESSLDINTQEDWDKCEDTLSRK